MKIYFFFYFRRRALFWIELKKYPTFQQNTPHETFFLNISDIPLWKVEILLEIEVLNS
jgi:hypothetical protein